MGNCDSVSLEHFVDDFVDQEIGLLTEDGKECYFNSVDYHPCYPLVISVNRNHNLPNGDKEEHKEMANKLIDLIEKQHNIKTELDNCGPLGFTLREIR